jgi:hypothetical protein
MPFGNSKSSDSKVQHAQQHNGLIQLGFLENGIGHATDKLQHNNAFAAIRI